jgi:hypothetical protein
MNARQVIHCIPTAGHLAIISMAHTNHLAMYCDIPNAADTNNKASTVAKTEVQTDIQHGSDEIKKKTIPLI